MQDKTQPPGSNECFYGTVSVGERGQVVIPSAARKSLGIKPGDKMLLWQHPSGAGLMLFRMESVRSFMDQMLATLEHAERHDSAGDRPDPDMADGVE